MIVCSAQTHQPSSAPVVCQVTGDHQPKRDRTFIQGKSLHCAFKQVLSELVCPSRDVVPDCCVVAWSILWHNCVCVCQKRKLSDQSVEAGEDYTKFNSADFLRKVSGEKVILFAFTYLRVILLSRFLKSHQLLFWDHFLISLYVKSVSSVVLCKFVFLFSSRPKRWLLLRKVWQRWTRLAWSPCPRSLAQRLKRKRNDYYYYFLSSGFLIKKRKYSWPFPLLISRKPSTGHLPLPDGVK